MADQTPTGRPGTGNRVATPAEWLEWLRECNTDAEAEAMLDRLLTAARDAARCFERGCTACCTTPDLNAVTPEPSDDPATLDDVFAGWPEPEWREEWRVTGMTFRRGTKTLTESSSAVCSPSPFDAYEARQMMERLQESRGGTVQRRRVVETEWVDA